MELVDRKLLLDFLDGGGRMLHEDEVRAFVLHMPVVESRRYFETQDEKVFKKGTVASNEKEF